MTLLQFPIPGVSRFVATHSICPPKASLKHATTNEKRSGVGAAAATDAFSDILKQEQIDDMNASPIIGVGCD